MDDTTPASQPAPRISVICPDAAVDAAYFAAALARELARRSRPEPRPVALIDGQPGTGGLDVVADLETAPGARWPALAGAGPDIDAAKLVAALPTRDGVAVLSAARGVPFVDDGVLHAVHGALRGVSAAVVSTAAPGAPPSSTTADCVVLLVRGTVAALAAAEAVTQALDTAVPCGLVMLASTPATVLATAEALALPVIAVPNRRWNLGQACAADVLAGRWPGHADRTMDHVVRQVLDFVGDLETQPAEQVLSWA